MPRHRERFRARVGTDACRIFRTSTYLTLSFTLMASASDEAAVIHHAEASRFEVNTPAGLAFAAYRLLPGVLVLTHTEVPQALEGKGIGSRLARAAFSYARERHLRVLTRCPFMASFVQRHAEYQDLLEPEP